MDNRDREDDGDNQYEYGNGDIEWKVMILSRGNEDNQDLYDNANNKSKVYHEI